MSSTIICHLEPRLFQFLRESKEKPGSGTIIIAEQPGERFWWVFDPFVIDGIEYHPSPPEHRCIDPASIRVNQKSKDYVVQQHRLIRLQKQPERLLELMRHARQPVRIIKRRRWPVVWINAKRWLLRAWRWFRNKVRSCGSRTNVE